MTYSLALFESNNWACSEMTLKWVWWSESAESLLIRPGQLGSIHSPALHATEGLSFDSPNKDPRSSVLRSQGYGEGSTVFLYASSGVGQLHPIEFPQLLHL